MLRAIGIALVLFYIPMRFFINKSRDDLYVTLPKWLEKMVFPFSLKNEASVRFVDGKKQRPFVVTCICFTDVLLIHLTVILGIVAILTGGTLNGGLIYFLEFLLIGISAFGSVLWCSIQDYRIQTTYRERRRKWWGVIFAAAELVAFVSVFLAVLFGWLE